MSNNEKQIANKDTSLVCIGRWNGIVYLPLKHDVPTWADLQCDMSLVATNLASFLPKARGT